MNKLFYTAVFLFGLNISVIGQELGQYQYVRIPYQFDFLKEENQYELNALTAFLFEKFGFSALYKESTPEGIGPCEVLLANVHSDSGLFRSKLYVTLENCHKEVVFTSKTGTSREKNFKVSYHEALREAFQSVEALHHKFTGEVVREPAISEEQYSEPSEVDSLPAEIIVDPVVTAEEVNEVKTPGTTEENEVIGQYRNGAVAYVLKTTSVGFELFKKGESARFASLIKSGGGENFLYASQSVSGNAYFDAGGNLIAEFVDSETGQLITVIYKKVQ